MERREKKYKSVRIELTNRLISLFTSSKPCVLSLHSSFTKGTRCGNTFPW